MLPCTPEQTKQSRAVSALAFATLVYLGVASVWPHLAFIQCPFHVVTGYSCPGCGMTRSCAAIMRGDLISSWEFHPFGSLFFFSAAGFTAFHVIRTLTRKNPPIPFAAVFRKYASQIWLGLFIGVVFYGTVRLALELLGILTPI